MSITASNNPYPSDPDPTPNKLDRAGYAGNALTLDQKIDANLAEAKALIEGVKGSTDLGSITPTSVPTGTGPAFWRATQNGTYTNFGGLVVNVNSFAVISRDAAGVFSISQTALNLTEYQKIVDINKVITYTNNIFDKDTFLDNKTVNSGNGNIDTATGYRTVKIPILVGQTNLTVSGLLAFASKAYAFYNGTTLINKAGITAQPISYSIPATATFMYLTFKVPTDAVTAGDTVMVNYGSVALPYEKFSYNLITTINGVKVEAAFRPIDAEGTNALVDSPIAFFGTDEKLAFLKSRLTYNKTEGFKVGHDLTFDGIKTAKGIRHGVNAGEAVPINQLNEITSVINLAIGKQPLQAFPETVNTENIVINAIATAHGITGAVSVSKNDTRFKVINGAVKEKGAAYPHYLYNISKHATGLTLSAPVSFEFGFDGTEIALSTFGFASQWRWIVDGKTVGNSIYTTTSDGQLYFQKITFPDAKLRQIRIEGGYNFCFGGIVRGTGNVYSPTRVIGKKYVFIGDSFTEPAGTTEKWNGWAGVSSKLLGLDGWQSGSGGTGYLQGSTDRPKYIDRINTDAIAYNPDGIVLAGGINDSATYTKPIFEAAIDAICTQIRASLPNIELVLVAPWRPNETANVAIYDAMSIIMKAKCIQYNAIFIETKGWLTGTGNAGSPNGTGNADLYISSDGIHPNTAGHIYLGQKFASAYMDSKNKIKEPGQKLSNMANATDANYTIPDNVDFVTLPSITANRTLKMPTNIDGKSLTIFNSNGSAFTWTVSGLIKDVTETTITTIANKTIIKLIGNFSLSAWLKI
jgi:lysophospholipase L1-like esterase